MDIKTKRCGVCNNILRDISDDGIKQCAICEKFICCGYMEFRGLMDNDYAEQNKTPIENSKVFVDCYNCLREILEELNLKFGEVDGVDIALELSSVSHRIEFLRDIKPKFD